MGFAEIWDSHNNTHGKGGRQWCALHTGVQQALPDTGNLRQRAVCGRAAASAPTTGA